MNRRQSDFARVYEEHVWRVYGFLAYRVPDRETAEDLTQATFERALRAWGRFDPHRATVGTWLLSIARNALIDYHRRASSRQTQQLSEHLHPTVPGPEERSAAPAALVNALAGLGDRELEVLALRFGGDLSGPEIADMLNLSRANVHQITSRALRKLKHALGEAGVAR